MKARFFIGIACVATALTSAGCDNARQTAAPTESKSAPAPSEAGPVPTQPVPALPDPVVPKGTETPSPAPGQANDHSNPAFKDGGKPDPHK